MTQFACWPLETRGAASGVPGRFRCLSCFRVVIDSSEQEFSACTLDGDREQHPGAPVAGDLERSMLQPGWILNVCTVSAEAQRGAPRRDGSVVSFLLQFFLPLLLQPQLLCLSRRHLSKMGPCNKSNAAFDDSWALTLIKCFIFYSVCVCVGVCVCAHAHKDVQRALMWE